MLARALASCELSEKSPRPPNGFSGGRECNLKWRNRNGQMRHAIMEGEKNIKHIPFFIEQVINTGAWRKRWVVSHPVEHKSFLKFINTPPLAGMGFTSALGWCASTSRVQSVTARARSRTCFTGMESLLYKGKRVCDLTREEAIECALHFHAAHLQSYAEACRTERRKPLGLGRKTRHAVAGLAAPPVHFDLQIRRGRPEAFAFFRAQAALFVAFRVLIRPRTSSSHHAKSASAPRSHPDYRRGPAVRERARFYFFLVA